MSEISLQPVSTSTCLGKTGCWDAAGKTLLGPLVRDIVSAQPLPPPLPVLGFVSLTYDSDFLWLPPMCCTFVLHVSQARAETSLELSTWNSASWMVERYLLSSLPGRDGGHMWP